MEIGKIIREKQPDVYKILINISKQIKYNHEYVTLDEDYSLKSFERMMRHDSYKRVGRSIRQVRHK